VSVPVSEPRAVVATERRALKFRQAAFVYLHVAILYEAAAWTMMRRSLLPSRFGPPWIWMLLGGVVAALVFVGLYRWQNVWFARAVWAVHGLRIPALVSGAFFPEEAPRVLPVFYLTALIVVIINLWMLARAGWDL
jgi:multidrug transporter EmrE-like cation transporter